MAKTVQISEDVQVTDMGDGTYYVHNTQTQLGLSVTRDELSSYIESTADPKYIPLGNMLAGVTKKLGIQMCLPCAERQAKLNRLWRRRKHV